MVETTARIKREGKHFEILVDLEEALKLRKGEGNINQAVLTNDVFYNLKSGEHASKEDLEKYFDSSDFFEICEKIIKNGEVVKTTDFLKEEQNQKYKQVVDFLVKNAISLEGRPYTPDRIMNALNEAHVNIKNKPIEIQINEILEQLNKVLPIKVERKKVKLRVSSMHIGKAYGYLKEYISKETWLNNGDLECIVEVPSGLIMDFYDKINSATHGSVLSEELK
ncbi:MAG: ribosome assembly factor SBDS [Candidatus Nanoarchaeia archaeon]|jgi:ribosome maturation protein SDO1|nr:ribosome assembly factor SBDS [Candidatus Nanoarchaeia archaeon]MDD3993602.1 ribosome assembly factor SBDS [Candidatus Nanoarchaeia archaeon]MDD4563412.1 ribosome assembly factor SBDS [Candidatus Nanoarchaeia archaeon]